MGAAVPRSARRDPPRNFQAPPSVEAASGRTPGMLLNKRGLNHPGRPAAFVAVVVLHILAAWLVTSTSRQSQPRAFTDDPLTLLVLAALSPQDSASKKP